MEKWIGRSRAIWAMLLSVLPGLVTVANGLGWTWLVPDLLEPVDGVVQSLLGLIAAVLILWSRFKPDNATLTLLPKSGA